MKKEKNAPEEMVEIPHDYLIEGVRKAADEIRQLMKDKRREHGSRYNWKNDYEAFGTRFGYDDAEKIWAEFALVFEKKSNQPASVRRIIKLLGDKARLYAITRMQQEYREREEKK